MIIYCCGCLKKVEARLTDGKEIYKTDKYKSLPFWKCDTCKNFVGCHDKTKERTKPLGCIPSPEIKNARKHIHALLDPLWQMSGNQRKARTALYDMIGETMGRLPYHTANIRSIEEARQVYKIILDLKKTITNFY